jgi:hypothetical protein
MGDHTDMGIHAWAARQTRLCGNADCRPRSQDAPPGCGGKMMRSCGNAANYSRNILAGYCALIWARPVEINGSLVGTVVSDNGAFRFFAADARLDEIDGMAWETLPELRSEVAVARSLSINSTLSRFP